MLAMVGLIAGHAAPVAAQSAADYREMQAMKLEWERQTVLAMVDSMPEHLLRDRVTEEQRDFAQQVHHAVSAVGFFSQRFMTDAEVPAADTSVVLNSRAALSEYVNAVYDFALAALRTQPEADRGAMADLFGQEVPKWAIWDEIHQHSTWTLGQIVANFRKHGMAPPAFSFF
jgi:hypothetical protein